MAVNVENRIVGLGFLNMNEVPGKINALWAQFQHFWAEQELQMMQWPTALKYPYQSKDQVKLGPCSHTLFCRSVTLLELW